MATADEPRPPTFDSPEQEAFLNLWRTYDRLRAFEDELFARFGLTPQQYNVLRLLQAAHPRPVPTLAVADRLVSRAPDITRMIDKLEAGGLVRRERPASDRRTVLVGVTAAGLDIARARSPGRCGTATSGSSATCRAADLKALVCPAPGRPPAARARGRPLAVGDAEHPRENRHGCDEERVRRHRDRRRPGRGHGRHPARPAGLPRRAVRAGALPALPHRRVDDPQHLPGARPDRACWRR